MTVIEIVLVFLIIWIVSIIGIAYKNHKNEVALNHYEWLDIIFGGLLITIMISLTFVIIGAIIYGLWNAPWYDWFHNKLW